MKFQMLTAGAKPRRLLLCTVGLVCAIVASTANARSIRVDGPADWPPTTTDPYPTVASSNPGSGAAGDTVSFATCDSGCADALSVGGPNFSGFTPTTGAELNWVNSSSTRDAQIVVWALSDITDGTTDLGAGFELELNGWCSPSGSSTTTPTLNWDGTTYSGGCSSVTNDLLFNSTGGLVGYVDDSSEPDCNFSNACTVTFASTLPTDWTKGSTVTSVPEPGALTLLAIALAMYLLTSRRLVRRSPPRHRGIARCS